MDASAELAELRMRAYGPHADIHLDPGALVRLAELEGFADPHSASGTANDELTAARAVHSDAAAPPGAPVPPSSARRMWKVPAWALVAGAVAVGVAVGLMATLVMSPKVVAQLRPTTESGTEFPFDTATIDPATLVRYDDFDIAQVWTARSTEGTACLFVAGSFQWLDFGCAPGELDPVVDIDVSDGNEAADFLGLPPGSLVRFMLRDGVVEVWVAEAAQG